MLEHKRGMALNDGTAHTVSLHFLCLRSMTKNAWKRNLHAHSLYKQWIFFWSAIKSRIDKQWPIPFNFMVSFFFICSMFCVSCFFLCIPFPIFPLLCVARTESRRTHRRWNRFIIFCSSFVEFPLFCSFIISLLPNVWVWICTLCVLTMSKAIVEAAISNIYVKFSEQFFSPYGECVKSRSKRKVKHKEKNEKT